MKGIKTFTYNEQDLFLRKYLDLFTLLYVVDDNVLQDREKEYFLENVKLNAAGIDLLSKQASDHLKALKFQIRTYRYNLKKKGWLIQTQKGIELPKSFDFKDKSIPTDLIFNFKFSLINE